MIKSKRLKALLLTFGLTFSFQFFSVHKAYAALYTAASGDSLYKISKLFNTTTTNLINDNNLKNTMIYPGQVLNVSCRTYTVQKGDSLYSIAQKNGITLSNLRTANNMWTDYLDCGRILNIPVTAITTTAQPSGIIKYSASDVDLLARLITAEAQGQPYKAKIAVGSVVLNRIKSGLFANSINAVIYQTINGYYQFTPVLNGWINKPADSESIKAAYAALGGEDPTKGALFYFDDSTTNKWLWSKPIAIIIDKLVFVY